MCYGFRFSSFYCSNYTAVGSSFVPTCPKSSVGWESREGGKGRSRISVPLLVHIEKKGKEVLYIFFFFCATIQFHIQPRLEHRFLGPKSTLFLLHPAVNLGALEEEKQNSVTTWACCPPRATKTSVMASCALAVENRLRIHCSK